jgi:hypothetical protein
MRESEIDTQSPLSPPQPMGRRRNWLLIIYEGLWDYPWTWRHIVLLLVALRLLGHQLH